jgi:hypothetical protein
MLINSKAINMSIKEKLISQLSPLAQANLFLKLFGLTKVPLIFYCRPKVIELNEKRTIIKIPFRRRTKNHLNSMYFGALCIGSDIAGGMIAMHTFRNMNRLDLIKSLAFKDLKVDFLKRPETDVYFICEDGDKISEMIRKTLESGERINDAVNIKAAISPDANAEVYANFVLTLSLKDASKRK